VLSLLGRGAAAHLVFLRTSVYQDEPSYYTRPGGFLAYTPDIPADMLKNSVPDRIRFTVNSTMGHFNLINHQLLQVVFPPAPWQAVTPVPLGFGGRVYEAGFAALPLRAVAPGPGGVLLSSSSA
jgi:hypothetical protein